MDAHLFYLVRESDSVKSGLPQAKTEFRTEVVIKMMKNKEAKIKSDIETHRLKMQNCTLSHSAVVYWLNGKVPQFVVSTNYVIIFHPTVKISPCTLKSACKKTKLFRFYSEIGSQMKVFVISALRETTSNVVPRGQNKYNVLHSLLLLTLFGPFLCFLLFPLHICTIWYSNPVSHIHQPLPACQLSHRSFCRCISHTII